MRQKAKPVLLGFSCPLSKTGSNQQIQDTPKKTKGQWVDTIGWLFFGGGICSFIFCSIGMLVAMGGRL